MYSYSVDDSLITSSVINAKEAKRLSSLNQDRQHIFDITTSYIYYFHY